MVGRGDKDGVNTLGAGNFTPIARYLAVVIAIVLIDNLFGLYALALANVAHGVDMNIALPEKLPHIPRTLNPQTDTPHNNPIARSDRTRHAKGRRRDNLWKRD
jgi:hypothetical protein